MKRLIAAFVIAAFMPGCNSPAPVEKPVKKVAVATVAKLAPATAVVDCPFGEEASSNRVCAELALPAIDGLRQGIEEQYAVAANEQDEGLRIYRSALERFASDWRAWTGSLDAAAKRDAGREIADVSAAQGRAEQAVLKLNDMVLKGYDQ